MEGVKPTVNAAEENRIVSQLLVLLEMDRKLIIRSDKQLVSIVFVVSDHRSNQPTNAEINRPIVRCSHLQAISNQSFAQFAIIIGRLLLRYHIKEEHIPIEQPLKQWPQRPIVAQSLAARRMPFATAS